MRSTKWLIAPGAIVIRSCITSFAARRRVLLKFQQRNGIEGFLDAFLEARQLRKGSPEALLEFEADISDAEALALDRDPKTEHLVRNLAFASWTSGMFPTLSDLQDELHTAALQKSPHQELCATLASLLRPWLRDGRYGPIVDGASNIDLGSVAALGN